MIDVIDLTFLPRLKFIKRTVFMILSETDTGLGRYL